MNALTRAMEDIKAGRFVLVFDSDSREAETDMAIASRFVDHDAVRRMRREAGGLICTIAPAETWRRLGLPYMAELFAESYERHPALRLLAPDDLPYDTKSAFSITINHRKTFTGIPDRDRALTISEFAKLGMRAAGMTDEEARAEFGGSFRAPGHVFLLNSQPKVLDERRGHTELLTGLLKLAGEYPSATICEMMGDDGRSLPKEEAKRYAERNGLAFVEGAEIIEAWEQSEWSQ